MKRHFKSKFKFEQIIGVQSIRRIAFILGEKVHTLTELATNADSYYKPFTKIQKDKNRSIDNPTGRLKVIQTKIHNRILSLYPLSNAVYGGVLGRDTKRNAEQHLRGNVVVRIDLHDCFHSTKDTWVYRTFRQQFHFSHEVALLLTRICTYNHSVPVGAPLSTALVNVIYDPLWERVKRYCLSLKHECTVFVDDLIISGPNADKLIPKIKQCINNRGLKVNWKKLRIQRNHKVGQEVTGCTVNNRIGIPIGKRQEIRMKIIKGALNSGQVMNIKGSISHASFINPKQGAQLKKLAAKKLQI